MAKGQKKLQEQNTQRSNDQYSTGKEAQARLVTGSPEFQAYQARVGKRRETIKKGDFADAEDFLSNRSAVATRKAKYDSETNLAPTGIGALGIAYANPNEVARQKQVQTDEFARDSALQAEEDKRGYIAGTEAMESDIIGKKIGADTTIMGTAFGQSNYNMSQAAQIAASRASVVPGIVGGVLSGALGVAGAYMMRPPVSTTGGG